MSRPPRFDWSPAQQSAVISEEPGAIPAERPETRARLRVVDPPDLTGQVHTKIVNIVSRGNYISTAGAAAGITEAKLRGWLLRGSQEKTGACARLVADIHKAAAESEIKDLDFVSKGSEDIVNKDGRIIKYGDAKCAMWKLERTRPEKFGQKITIEAKNAAADYVLDLLREGMSPDGFDEVINILESVGKK